MAKCEACGQELPQVMETKLFPKWVEAVGKVVHSADEEAIELAALQPQQQAGQTEQQQPQQSEPPSPPPPPTPKTPTAVIKLPGK